MAELSYSIFMWFESIGKICCPIIPWFALGLALLMLIFAIVSYAYLLATNQIKDSDDTFPGVIFAAPILAFIVGLMLPFTIYIIAILITYTSPLWMLFVISYLSFKLPWSIIAYRFAYGINGRTAHG